MTEDPKRTVRLLWGDHLSSSKNKNNTATLTFSSVSTGVSSTAAWYSFDDPPIALDARAGITGMRFVVDGKVRFRFLSFLLRPASVSSSPRCNSFISCESERSR
jgi:hypothetical protein